MADREQVTAPIRHAPSSIGKLAPLDPRDGR